MTTDTTAVSYGTEPRALIPSAYVAAGFYEASPASLRPNGSKPRPFFNMTTEEGQAAYAAYVADLKGARPSRISPTLDTSPPKGPPRACSETASDHGGQQFQHRHRLCGRLLPRQSRPRWLGRRHCRSA